MHSVLTIGGATRDMYLTIPAQEAVLSTSRGEKINATGLAYHVGGGAANAAISFARQGLKTGICAVVGADDAGLQIRTTLRHENVDTALLFSHSTEPTATSVVLKTNDGQSTIIAYRGSASTLGTQWLSSPHLASYTNAYLAALSNQAIPLLPTIALSLRSRYRLLACNPGSAQLTSTHIGYFYDSLASLDIVMMNQREATTCAQALGQTALAPRQLASVLLSRGPSLVVITNGKQGAYAYTATESHYAPSQAAVVVDTVGAGDAFCSSFVAALIQRKSIQDALRLGSIQSAAAVAMIGGTTGLLDANELAAHSTI